MKTKGISAALAIVFLVIFQAAPAAQKKQQAGSCYSLSASGILARVARAKCGRAAYLKARAVGKGLLLLP